MSAASDPVLVTGGTGFLGQSVVRQLAEMGQAVRAMVRPGGRAAAFDCIRREVGGCELEVISGSLSDRSALVSAMAGVGAVLHIAAAKSGSTAAQVASTVVVSDFVCQAALEARVPRIVVVSSLGVLGAAGVPRGGVVDEDTPCEPHPERRDPYSFAKLRQEQIAWKHHRESGLPLVVVRPGVILGPGKNLLSARVGLPFFGTFLHLGQGATVPLTYVDNCADAVVRAGRVRGIEGRAFCLVDDALPTSRQLLRLYRRRVEAIAFVPVPFPLLRVVAKLNVWYSRRTQGHLPEVFTPYKVDSMWKGHRYSNARAKRDLGWSMKIPMDVALARSFVRAGPDRTV